MPFAMPDWAPWWLPLAVLLPALFFGLAFLLMPFSVFGLKGRLDGIEARLDEIQAEIRALALRLPEPGPMPAMREPAPPQPGRPRRPEPAPAPPPYADPVAGEDADTTTEEPPRPRRTDPAPAPRPHIPPPPWESGADDEEMPPPAPSAPVQSFRFQRPAAGPARAARPPIPPAPPPEPPEAEQEQPLRGGRFALRRNEPDRGGTERGASRDAAPGAGRAEPRLNWPRGG